MATLNDLTRYLDNNAIEYRIMTHVPAYSAHNVAMVTHVPDEEMAKTVLVRADHTYWLAVLPAQHVVGERLLKHVLEVHDVHLASEDDLETVFPGCESGAMPPFGNLFGLPVIVDRAIAMNQEIVFNACSHTESIRMKFWDFERLVRPVVADFADPRVAHRTEAS